MSDQVESKPVYQHPISVDEMWSLSNREDKNWGIEGYEIHKNYFDSYQNKKLRERNDLNEKVWARRGHYPKKPVQVDKEGKPIILKRPNYLDEVVKVANSFYDKAKAEKWTEELKDKSLKPLDRKKKEDVRRAPRVLFTDWMIKMNKKNNEVNKEKYASFEAIEERIKEHDKKRQKLSMEYVKEKYCGDKGRRGTSMCERVSITSEAIFVGEQLPFYQTAPPKEGENEKYEDVPGGDIKRQVGGDNAKERKYKKFKVLFYPRKYCLSNWTKAPAWVYKKKLPKAENFDYKKIEQDIKEKTDKVKEHLEKIKARLQVDVPKAWFETNYHGRIYVTWAKPAKITDQYTEWKKNNPLVYPGPQHYWKRHTVKYVAGKAKPIPPKPIEQEEGKPKIYILDDKYQMKHVYKPMKSHLF